MRLTERLRVQLKKFGRTPNNWETLSIKAGLRIGWQTFKKLLSDEEEVNVDGETIEKLYALLLGGDIRFGNPKFPEPKTGRPKKGAKV